MGPKMRALGTERQREFVRQLVGQTKRNASAAYRAAGYKPGAKAVSVDAYQLYHDERIQAALMEETRRQMHGIAPAAVMVAEAIMNNEDAKDDVRLKAAFGFMDRAGLHQVVEHKHTVGLAGDTEMLARIRLLAERNGIPLANLLGGRLAGAVVEGESEVIGLALIGDNAE